MLKYANIIGSIKINKNDISIKLSSSLTIYFPFFSFFFFYPRELNIYDKGVKTYL